MKKPEDVMEILEAYDLTGSFRAAAGLVGCDHKTVARLVAAREAAGGGLPERARQRPLVDPFAEKIDELVDRSRALARADVVHSVLVAMGYQGSYRTTHRAVAEAKRRWRNNQGRRTRPWIPHGHLADDYAEMCARLWWQEPLSGAQHRLALFASFPIPQIEVVTDRGGGKHVATKNTVSRAGVPVVEVER
jgi:hypothetical protein